METVRFVSAKPYLNVSDEEFSRVFFCTKGRQEIVIECSEVLKAKLKDITTEYTTHRLSEIKDYLIANNIPFIEDYKGTTRM